MTGVVLIDLHKAFDTVNVNILLSKLSMFGISGVKRRWFQSYLTDRSQSVMSDGHLSDRLSINVAKCAFMLIGTHQALQKMIDIRVHINNEHLKRVSVANYIDMYIDENLKWNVHIDNIVPKISAKIGVLRSLRNIIPTAILKLLYNAIVLPHFVYD